MAEASTHQIGPTQHDPPVGLTTRRMQEVSINPRPTAANPWRPATRDQGVAGGGAGAGKPKPEPLSIAKS
ncbi:MAG: hypothetical protein JOZ57_10765 [Abitibacteriaceae bacterium]|nr:hypothetical protein [Abditibacteriaceae bacterium]